MPLEIPTADEIEQRIFLRMMGEEIPLTDLTTISVARILIRSMVVEEMSRIWTGLGIVQDAYFLDTASGEDLDRRMADYDLTRPAAVRASGTVAVTATGAGATVDKGVVFKTNPTDPTVPVKRYSVTANPDESDGSWPISASATVNVSVQAEEAGESGNTAANTIVAMDNQVAGVDSLTNEVALINGAPEANDDEFREYFQAWLLSLSGGTRGDVLFSVKNYVDPATKTKPIHSAALEEWDGSTTLDGYALRVWIEDGSGTASASLVQAIQRLLDGIDLQDNPGIRPAGVRAQVRPSTAASHNVVCTIDISSAYGTETVRRQVEDVIRAHIGSIPVSGLTLTGDTQGRYVHAQLFREVMNVDGVLRVSFTTPTSDRAVDVGQKLVPGTISVTVSSVT